MESKKHSDFRKRRRCDAASQVQRCPLQWCAKENCNPLHRLSVPWRKRGVHARCVAIGLGLWSRLSAGKNPDLLATFVPHPGPHHGIARQEPSSTPRTLNPSKTIGNRLRRRLSVLEERNGFLKVTPPIAFVAWLAAGNVSSVIAPFAPLDGSRPGATPAIPRDHRIVVVCVVEE